MSKRKTNSPECRARAGVELRAVTDAEKTSGYIGALVGTIPYNTDSAELRDRRLNSGRPFVEQVAPDAFKRSLADDKDIMAFAGHTDAPLDAFARIGENLTVTTDKDALTWRALIPDTQAGRDLRTLAEKKIIRGTSFEFNARDAAGEKWEKRGNQDVRVITDARLYSVNPVAWPAYTDSELTVDMRSLRNARAYTQYQADDYYWGDPSMTGDAAFALSCLGLELAELSAGLEYLRESPNGPLAAYASEEVADAAEDVAMLTAWLATNGATVNPELIARAAEKLSEARKKNLADQPNTDDDRERRARFLRLAPANR